VAWLTSAFVCLLWQTVALADSKLTHGWAGGQLIFPEVIMSRHSRKDTFMEALLVLIVIILSIVLIVLTVKYNGKKEELHKLTVNMQDLAHKQYQAWVASDSQNIRTQQLDLARREAAAALEEWKSSSELAIRNDAIQRSQSVILGKVTEHLVPYLPTFTFNPKDARFIGSPIDILVFDGMDEGELREIVS
jgi:predicted Holliday junction resolvase-like endonuclease